MWAFIVFINIDTIFFLSLQKHNHYGILEGFLSILSYHSLTYDDTLATPLSLYDRVIRTWILASM